MKVIVRYFTTLRELAGSPEEEMPIEEGETLADLIEKIALKLGKEAQNYLYHEGKKIDPSIHLLINGTDSRILSGANTELKNGDIIAVIPPIGGG